MRITRPLLLAALLAGTATQALAQGTTLRIGLQEDPDALDPHRARTFVGRMVFSSLCGKLVDVAPDLSIVPEMATQWSWNEDNTVLTLALREDAVFHDGTPFDAQAVRLNIERAMELPDSLRRSELASVERVEVVGEHAVAFHLSEPDATLLSQLSDRAGMMMSPASFEGNFAQQPVCSGPYRFVERVQNDRIVLEKFEDHWEADEYHFDRLVFLPIPDATVRLANLQSGDIELLERLAPNDIAAVEADPNLVFLQEAGTGYVSLRINTGNGELARTPMGQDARVRRAFQLSIDRDVINEVVGFGIFTPAQQPFPPASAFYDESIQPTRRDVEAARALLAEAGHERVPVELTFGITTTNQQVSELIQAMAAEAGFDVTLRPTEFAAMQQEMTAGNFTVAQAAWSGRPDPDGNIHPFATCEGSLNDGRYCNEEVDRLLTQARRVTDTDERVRLYSAAQAILQEELPHISLYYQVRAFGVSARLQGFAAHPDGMIRLKGVTLSD
ncbi:ABC transporter substrate-binding protein [Aureimonas populi]|uniref:ABC transporter substrate-binding protein n=1 Tax=Aureimonas populi TaxID=1701758 RepID=A0ABW5CQZ6_9HYPH|nr:ABC transporter substrate-binding protein [Aureimonas populi]